jgi:hypothetical protein
MHSDTVLFGKQQGFNIFLLTFSGKKRKHHTNTGCRYQLTMPVCATLALNS